MRGGENRLELLLLPGMGADGHGDGPPARNGLTERTETDFVRLFKKYFARK